MHTAVPCWPYMQRCNDFKRTSARVYDDMVYRNIDGTVQGSCCNQGCANLNLPGTAQASARTSARASASPSERLRFSWRTCEVVFINLYSIILFNIHKLMKLNVLFWGRRQEDVPRAFPIAPSAQDLHLCGLSRSCNDLGLDGHIKPQVMKNPRPLRRAWRSSSPAGSCSSDKRLSASASQGVPRRNQVFIRWGSFLTRGPDQRNA